MALPGGWILWAGGLTQEGSSGTLAQAAGGFLPSGLNCNPARASVPCLQLVAPRNTVHLHRGCCFTRMHWQVCGPVPLHCTAASSSLPQPRSSLMHIEGTG
jgi:hypothetical protein